METVQDRDIVTVVNVIMIIMCVLLPTNSRFLRQTTELNFNIELCNMVMFYECISLR